MGTIWKGAISFGLVNIPVRVESATRDTGPRFKMLDGKDNTPIKTLRIRQSDEQPVEYKDLVKGYEYEPGHYVILDDEDFQQVALAVTRTIDIMDFVDESQIDSRYFEKPYYLAVQPGGEKAYALLRKAMRDTSKVAVAKVVFRNREHLAAVKVVGDALVLDLMRFHDELIPLEAVQTPKEEKLSEKEVEMAHQLKAAGEEVALTARTGGDARVVATVERADGSPLTGARVVLSHIDSERGKPRPVRVRSGATDLEGRVAFRDLRAGPAILQVITPEGCGYHLRFSIDEGDPVVFTYALPDPKHRISGEVSAEARGRYRMLRLEGELPRVVAGRRKSEGHVFAVETPVAEDGSFRFPPVPSLGKAEIGGRPARNPNADPVEVVTRPAPAEAVGRDAPAASSISVDR